MNNEIDNLKLWNSVDKTDPAHTKKAKKGQYNFTAITPISQFKKATEAFGVQGIGWGISVGTEVFQEKEYGTTIILSYDAVLFFIVDGVRGELPIHASEKSCYQTQGANGYMKIDDEVRKKVVTNAKTKGLSELGFNADVFMGMFDDPNYVDYRNYEESIEKSENRSQEITEKTEEFNSWCRSEILVYSSLKNISTLTLVYAGHIEKMTGRCNLLGLDLTKYKKQFIEAFDKQKQTIEGKK